MSADLPLSPEDVVDIVAILDNTPYDRIDIRSNRYSLTVARSGDGWVQTWKYPESPADAVLQSPDGGKPDAVSPLSTADAQYQGSVRAPLPGTFYRGPQPGAPAFIEVGSRVEIETVVGIIETMKLMTSVHAGVAGVVVAALVENAAMVDANDALFQVDSTPQ